MSLKRIIRVGACLSCFIVTSGLSTAESLKIALASEPTALDPHYSQLSPNIAAASHMFEALTWFDADLKLQPKLASSWTRRDDTTWVFHLQKNVHFSNGALFTSKDVIYTLCRSLLGTSGSSGGDNDIIRMMASVNAEDPFTVVIKMKQVYPLLPEDLSFIPMIWSGLSSSSDLRFDPSQQCGVTSGWPSVDDFNAGRASIGTGPYLLESYTKGGAITLKRNEQYWGTLQDWDRVVLQTLTNASARMAAFSAGEFDVVEQVPARDIASLTKRGFLIQQTPSVRVIVLELDSGRKQSPWVHAPQGGNPLQDVRVRQAISMAIDRDAIVSKVLDGAGVPAYQFSPDGMYGALEKAPVIPYDPERAKALLAEAGYPKGFDLTLHGPNDRYVADSQVLQAVGQYLSRIGIKTKVDTMTRSVYYPKRQGFEFSASLMGWSSMTGEASNYLRFFVATRDEHLGTGAQNFSQFSSPAFDKQLLSAIRIMDTDKREQALKQATEMALSELPQVPLHFESSLWAYRPGLSYVGRRDQLTTAMSVKRVVAKAHGN